MSLEWSDLGKDDLRGRGILRAGNTEELGGFRVQSAML